MNIKMFLVMFVLQGLSPNSVFMNMRDLFNYMSVSMISHARNGISLCKNGICSGIEQFSMHMKGEYYLIEQGDCKWWDPKKKRMVYFHDEESFAKFLSGSQDVKEEVVKK